MKPGSRDASPKRSRTPEVTPATSEQTLVVLLADEPCYNGYYLKQTLSEDERKLLEFCATTACEEDCVKMGQVLVGMSCYESGVIELAKKVTENPAYDPTVGEPWKVLEDPQKGVLATVYHFSGYY